MNTEGDEEKVKFYSEEHKFSCFNFENMFSFEHYWGKFGIIPKVKQTIQTIG